MNVPTDRESTRRHPAGTGCGADEGGGGRGGQRHPGRTGQRHWLRITGLPGWKRAELNLPAFGDANCVPHRREGFVRRVVVRLVRQFGRRQGEAGKPSVNTNPDISHEH